MLEKVGIDIAAEHVHIKGVDISNGDDSICVKSPSHHIMVEDSIVSSGNGLVIGTADDGMPGDEQEVANVSNVTFRNCIVNDTTFGCHIKFKPPQHGSVRNVSFENIRIHQTEQAAKRRTQNGDWAGYAIGLHQGNQGVVATSNGSTLPTFVAIENITFSNISGNVLHAGQFECSLLTHGTAPCQGIVLEHVHIDAKIDGCRFSQIHDIRTIDVSPPSCAPSHLH